MTDPFRTKGVPGYEGKKVCVTGATGLIGSYVVKLLVESGAEVRAVWHKRPPNEFTKLAQSVFTTDQNDCGLMSYDETRYVVQGCDIVMGCAGITGGVNLPSLDPVSYVGPATAMVINTLQACVEEKVQRFGYLSSTTVYPPSEDPVLEEDADSGKPYYPLYRGIGMSKRFLERLCRYYHETTGLGVSVIRPSGAYGRFDNFSEKTSHVVPGMISRALALGDGKEFEVWGDGEDVRDFIHAQDVARCMLIATAKIDHATPYNCASGQGITTRELAENVLIAVGSDAEIKLRPDKPSALKKRLVGTTRAERVLGFKTEISLADGLSDTVAWRRENS